MEGDADFPWHVGVYDAHCHVAIHDDLKETISALKGSKARGLASFATRARNLRPISQLAKLFSCPQNADGSTSPHQPFMTVIPGFGWHPWFSHQLYIDDTGDDGKASPLEGEDKIAHFTSVLTADVADHDFIMALPDPVPISVALAELRRNLMDHPLAMVAEIGLDKSFRIPNAWLPGQNASAKSVTESRAGRRLSPFRVHIDHQIAVLKAQLTLAAELGRAVSVHGVQAHGVLFNVLNETWQGHRLQHTSKRQKRLAAKEASFISTIQPEEGSDTPDKPSPSYPPRICLHSFSGSVDLLKQYLDPKIPADIFFSFSTFNNFSQEINKAEASVKAVPDQSLLVETDMSHTEDLDEQLVLTARKLCHLKGWPLEEGLVRLRDNYLRFVYGNQMLPVE